MFDGIRDEIQKMVEKDPIQAQALAYESLMDVYKFATMNDTKEIYVYNGVGIYNNQGEQIIHKQLSFMFGNYGKINTFKEIKHRIQGGSYVERIDFNKDTDLLPLENGILNLKTKELFDYAPEHKFTFKIPVEYNPKATCPGIDRFIEEVFHIEDIPIAYEIPAYTLYRKTPIQKAIMFLGEGSNGKSVYLQMLIKFLGFDNVSNIPLQDLAENRFALTELFGKMANIYPDLEETALKTTGKIKAAISGDRLPYEKKHKDIGSFEPYAKHLFSTNKLPKTRDNSFAYFRRWCIIECERKFTKELGNVDQDKISKITTPEELSGLLNKCLEILPKLLEQKDFTQGRTKKIELKWIRASDSIKAFITECVKKDSSAPPITKDKLYEIYQKYCEVFECEFSTPQLFGRDFKTFVPYANHILQEVIIDDRPKRVKSVRGFRVINPEESNDTDDTDIIGLLYAGTSENNKQVEINGNIGNVKQADLEQYNNNTQYHLNIYNYIAMSGTASLGDLLGEFQGFEVEAILKDLCDAGKVNMFKHNEYEVVR